LLAMDFGPLRGFRNDRRLAEASDTMKGIVQKREPLAPILTKWRIRCRDLSGHTQYLRGNGTISEKVERIPGVHA
ncbi:MAG: hypothetical protein D6795_16795, partial [Deltaproteobacteria bacterium]